MMEAMKKEYSISEMADALEVSASGYAEHLKKEERPRKRQDREFGEKLKVIFHGSRKTYGLPRLQRALRSEGIGCGKKRLARGLLLTTCFTHFAAHHFAKKFHFLLSFLNIFPI